ncbi:pyridoxal-dependent decarboxylase [Streptomyces sp. NPDC058955]|uniref:pyridoxal-dependent decarboxylase n=1 Tax=unclassified Streptomyces TaxID=2593676 RepID=UPI003668290D
MPTTWFLHPHKWLSAPFYCAALLYRDPRPARAAHTQNASCLDALHTDDDTQWNPSDYAHHLSRRARGLRLWFSLAVHGTRAYSEAMEKARTTAALIRTAPYLELVHEPELSAVTFRRSGWTAEDYAEWSARLLAGQTAFAAPTGWEGETVARFTFLPPPGDRSGAGRGDPRKHGPSFPCPLSGKPSSTAPSRADRSNSRSYQAIPSSPSVLDMGAWAGVGSFGDP